MIDMATEHLLNKYYCVGGFNRPQLIGYMMKMIRDLKPLTVGEWKAWYLENVHDEKYIEAIARAMHESIPGEYQVSFRECLDYICDVMFRRTFQGYNKEHQALNILRKAISPNVQEAPADWDALYFIDFYLYSSDGRLIGIQLKPETFYLGKFYNLVDICGKMNAFRLKYDADVFVLRYSVSETDQIVFVNPEVIDEICCSCCCISPLSPAG